MRSIFLIILVGLIWISSCKNISTDISEDTILEYSNQYLTLSNINFPKNIGFPKEDSIQWVENYKKQWLYNQIIIEKAGKYLPKSELNIENDLLQYRADLLKYKYENYFIKNKIKTQVSSSEISEFYQENQKALKSSKTLVKAIYIEIQNTVKDKYKIKQWLASKNEKNQEKLKDYCFRNANVFDDFEDEWIEFNLLKLMSHSQQLKESKSILNRVIEQKNDSLTYYFLVNEIVFKGELMPIEYAKPEIAKTIINKRRIQLLEEFNYKINQELEAQLHKK